MNELGTNLDFIEKVNVRVDKNTSRSMLTGYIFSEEYLWCIEVLAMDIFDLVGSIKLTSQLLPLTRSRPLKCRDLY